MMSVPEIEIRDVSLTFNEGTNNEIRLFENISFSINSGEVVAIRGDNGSGKTTLLRLIAGQLKPDKGRILLKGTDVTQWPAYKRARMLSYVYQDPMLGTCPNLTVHENLALYEKQRLFAITSYAKMCSQPLLSKLSSISIELEKHRSMQVRYLSGGQKQALAIMASLSDERNVVLLDEYSSSLDETVLRLINLELVHLAGKHNRSMLFVTHDKKFLELNSHKTLLLKDRNIELVELKCKQEEPKNGLED